MVSNEILRFSFRSLFPYSFAFFCVASLLFSIFLQSVWFHYFIFRSFSALHLSSPIPIFVFSFHSLLSVGGASLYSRSPWFKLVWRSAVLSKVLRGFPSSPRKMLVKYLKLGYDHFFPQPLQFTIILFFEE